MTKKPTARAAATTERDECEAAARQWVASKAQTQLELAQLLEQSGDLILDDPTTVDGLAVRISQARARLEMTDRAIAQALQRHVTAARTALLAEADELDAPISKKRAELAEYEQHTEELLAPLVAHTGRGWRMVTSADSPYREQLQRHGRVEIGTPNDRVLRESLQELEESQSRLRAAAESVAPLNLTDVALARASIRLHEVSGEMSQSSRDNLEAAALQLHTDAEGLVDTAPAALAAVSA